ncbi:MAG TPA: glycosyltransferase [Bacteroidetes bacterium]|nr:glycosyltransferase [Bacteroidota bacterium]
MKIGIIIPTKNEEKHLPLLADSIKNQDYKNYKVFVADANSNDNTRKIAKDYGFKIVEGGMPFTGRNNGADEAINNGCELLIFIDADIILPTHRFLSKAISEFRSRQLDIAGTFQRPYKLNEYKNISFDSPFKYKLIYYMANIAMDMLKSTKRPMFQVCMFATATAHQKIGGFKNLEYGEDSRYSTDGKQLGLKFGMLKSTEKVLISPRRFEEKGFIRSGTPKLLMNVLIGQKYFYDENNKVYFT